MEFLRSSELLFRLFGSSEGERERAVCLISAPVAGSSSSCDFLPVPAASMSLFASLGQGDIWALSGISFARYQLCGSAFICALIFLSFPAL